MPLPLKQRKVAAIEYIVKRIKGNDSYDKMKSDNESGNYEKMYRREKPESDYKIGCKMAANEAMNAIKSNDSEAFERALRGFVSMLLDEREDEIEMMKRDEDDHEKKMRGEGY